MNQSSCSVALLFWNMERHARTESESYIDCDAAYNYYLTLAIA